ncbi:unnamed protein product, partial [Mesorhabditis spiculigera]
MAAAELEPNAVGLYVYLPSFTHMMVDEKECRMPMVAPYRCDANWMLWYDCCDTGCCGRLQPWLYVLILGTVIAVIGLLVAKLTVWLCCGGDREEEDVLFDKNHYAVHNHNYLRPPPPYSSFSRNGSLRKHTHGHGHST